MNRALWSRIFKLALNFWPCIRFSGGRITHLSEDFTVLRVKLPLTWRTRNRVGTIYGGSMYSATDPFYMLMLMEILGREFVVWDKAGTIRFKRPAQETLFVEFKITTEMLADVRNTVEQCHEGNFVWTIQLKSASGVVHAEIDKTLYVAKKSFYREKIAKRNQLAEQT